jgi:hypothetical protein
VRDHEFPRFGADPLGEATKLFVLLPELLDVDLSRGERVQAKCLFRRGIDLGRQRPLPLPPVELLECQVEKAGRF